MALNAVKYERAARVLSVDVEVPWEKVSKRLRSVSGKMVILMHPTPDRVGQILLPDSQKRIRADVGTVVASPPPFKQDGVEIVPPKPGTVVIVHPADGTTVDFEGHRIKSIGAFIGEMEWTPQTYPWYESVMACIEGDRLVPYGDKVIIQLDPEHRKSEGGILIPDIAQVHLADATIEAVGPLNPDRIPEGARCSVDMNLVTSGGVECIFGKAFERVYAIPPSAINFLYLD